MIISLQLKHEMLYLDACHPQGSLAPPRSLASDVDGGDDVTQDDDDVTQDDDDVIRVRQVYCDDMAATSRGHSAGQIVIQDA